MVRSKSWLTIQIEYYLLFALSLGEDAPSIRCA